MPSRFHALFASADDRADDAETTRLEDGKMTLDEIVAACRRYSVRAQVVEAGQLVCTIVPADERASSARGA